MAFTISRAVEEYVKQNPFIQEALSRGVLNYLAFAEEIKPSIERELKKEVKEPAIIMALRRLNDKLDKKFNKGIRFSSDSDISIRSDLFELTVKKNPKSFSIIKKFSEIVDVSKDFFAITQGTSEITIISNRRYKNKLEAMFSKNEIIGVINNLASLGIMLPFNSTQMVGFFYTTTRAFAWEDISIIEIVSTLNELNLIINEKDVPRSFSMLQEMIKRQSR